MSTYFQGDENIFLEVDEEYIEQAKVWYEDILNCLVKYGAKTPKEASDLVRASFIPRMIKGEVLYLFREIPYYWAMVLLYDHDDPQWYKNSKLWPPPNDYHAPS